MKYEYNLGEKWNKKTKGDLMQVLKRFSLKKLNTF